MKKIYNIVLASTLLFSAMSCDDFLDRAPGVSLDEKKVFETFVNAEKFHANIYANLRSGFNICGGFEPVPLACASDEADAHMGFHATNGSFNIGNYEGADNDIYGSYVGIRNANEFIKNSGRVPFPSEKKRDQMMGEVYFLRAYYFNEMIKRYGGMPIMTENDLLVPGDDLLRPRDSYKACVNHILSDLEKAIPMLPISLPENEYGRITRGVALTLKAKVLLFAASPAYAQEMDNTVSWKDVENAAKAVIDLKDEDGELVYELYDTGAGSEDYYNLFFTRREKGNKEVIFSKHAGTVGFSDAEVKIWAPKGGELGGAGAVSPTQNFVDLYEMADGSNFDWNNNTHKANPFANRDPRFYVSILYHGSDWQGEKLQLNLGGAHRKDAEYTRTGYAIRKYLPIDVKNKTSNRSYHEWIYYRLADVYLIYAEALLAQGNANLALRWVNDVRKRSGVVLLKQADLTMEKLYQERAIELAFEEQRWWDARRWNKATEWFDGPMYACQVTVGATTTYDKQPFYNRIYRSYMNRYPIPLGEMRKNPLFTQNSGW